MPSSASVRCSRVRVAMGMGGQVLHCCGRGETHRCPALLHSPVPWWLAAASFACLLPAWRLETSSQLLVQHRRPSAWHLCLKSLFFAFPEASTGAPAAPALSKTCLFGGFWAFFSLQFLVGPGILPPVFSLISPWLTLSRSPSHFYLYTLTGGTSTCSSLLDEGSVNHLGKIHLMNILNTLVFPRPAGDPMPLLLRSG